MFKIRLNIFKNSIQCLKYSTRVNEGPLRGVRILDLTRIVAGPFCTMILGDLGAEVIKIEMPGRGDEARKWGPPWANNSSESCYFACLNRNKKSVCVDLKKGHDVIVRLVKQCDVLIENYVPGKLNKLRLGYEDLNNVAPHLIYCSLTGYGSKGPYKDRPGYDVIAASVGGLMHITGTRDEPVKTGVALTDIATGLYAHGAILAALIERAKTGKGQKIDCNLLSTQLSCLINIGSNYLNASEEAQRWGSSHVSIVPYRAYKTKDNKFITIGTGSDEQFRNLCQKVNAPHLADDLRYKTNKDRVAHRPLLDSILENIFVEKTCAEWLDLLEGSLFPYGPVNNMQEAFDDDHVRDINIVQQVEHPVAGNIKLVGPAVEFSYSENKIRSPPPTLGQHTTSFLSEVGFSNEEIKNLKNAGIVA